MNSVNYVTADAHGVRRVAGTRISIDSVVIGFQQGQSPEEIHRNFPTLTLEQVYGVITYYLANRENVHAYLQQQQENWNLVRANVRQTDNPAIQRLQKMREHKAGLPQ